MKNTFGIGHWQFLKYNLTSMLQFYSQLGFDDAEGNKQILYLPKIFFFSLRCFIVLFPYRKILKQMTGSNSCT